MTFEQAAYEKPTLTCAGIRRRFFIMISGLVITGMLLGTHHHASAQVLPASVGPADAKLIEDLVAANRILVEKGAIMMRGHGVVVSGFSLPAVVGRSVYLDMNAQVLSRTLASRGKPIYLRPPENAAAVNNDYAREWEAWKRRVTMK